MPFAAPDRPRKMFPPPITMQSCVPASTASLTSAAMRSTVPMSIPKASLPINASPDTLSRTRRYFGADGMKTFPLLGRGLLRELLDLVGEVAIAFLDAFADLEAHEAVAL